MAAQGGMVLGGEKTSHDNGGVKYVVKQTGQRVELEGDEFVLCDDIVRSQKYYVLTGTPYEIILKLASEGSCKIGALSEIQGGEFVICKKVIRDNQTITVSGTPAEIISQLQVEKGCNPHWSWDLERQDGETCDVCEHDKKKMAKGGSVDAEEEDGIDEEYINQEPIGDCIKAASDLIMFPDRAFYGIPYVVHAECAGAGKLKGIRFGHAWVEDDYFVYDYANGSKDYFPKQLYYQAGDVKELPKKYKRYTEDEFIEKLFDSGKYDFWDLDVKYESRGEIIKSEPKVEIDTAPEPTTVEEVEAELGNILSEYGSRKMGAIVAYSYITKINRDLAAKFTKEKGLSGMDKFNAYVIKLHNKSRSGKGNERAERKSTIQREKADMHLANIEKLALEQSAEMEEKLEHKFGKYANGGQIDSRLISFVEPDSMMPMATDFGNGALYQTSLPIFEKGGEVKLLAPNSKQSKLNKEQYHIVRTAKFKKWFGIWDVSPNSSSQILDSNNEPLVVYHGSEKEFNVFKKQEDAAYGFHFSGNKDYSAQYGRLKSFFLSAKNVYHTTEEDVESGNGLVPSQVEALGYDGWCISYPDGTSDYAVFNPEQIKLADGSNVTFDSSNPDVRFEKGGEVAPSFVNPTLKALYESIPDLKKSQWSKEKQKKELKTIDAYLSGDLKALAEKSLGGYTSIIIDYRYYENGKRHILSVKEGMEDEPVPCGLWLDLWEQDFLTYYKVKKDAYYNLNIKERANLETDLQLKLWTKEQFWMNYAAFYMPVIYHEWMWGSGNGYSKSLEKQMGYWNDYMKNERPEKFAKGGAIQNPPTKAELEARWDKKKEHIMQLSTILPKLRYNVTSDMKSDDEKTRLTALVIAVMDKTGERVGNELSEEEGHYGVTGFKKKHVKIDGNRVSLSYTGKSGVDHVKSFTDGFVASVLKDAIKNSPDEYVFTTSDGFKIKADRINRFLSEYNITAKDLRGFYANKYIVKKLEGSAAPKDEKDREKTFREAVKYAAEKVGHGAATLKNHYLIPELEKAYITRGRLINLAGFYKTGGMVKMAEGGAIEEEPVEYWGDAAVGALIYAKDTGKFLLLQRSELVNEPLTWNGISGGIESHETPEEALLREMDEEMGFKGKIDLKLGYVFNSKDEDFVFYNFVGVVPNEFEPDLNWENSDHKWTALDKIPAPQHFGLKKFINEVDIENLI